MTNRGNRGATSLKCKRRVGNPMGEYDRLPEELRAWVAGAILPWRVRSVRSAYARELAARGDPKAAVQALSRIEQRLVAKDSLRIWGAAHPGPGGVHGP